MTENEKPSQQGRYLLTDRATEDVCSGVTSGSSLTPLDMSHSVTYARMRLTKEKCDHLSSTLPTCASDDGKTQIPRVKWVDTFADKSVPYYCPDGLTGANACVHGHCRIQCAEECNNVSNIPYDPNTGDWKPQGNNNTYLEYRKDAKGDSYNHCYLGNYLLRRWCEVPSTRNPPGKPEEKFSYDPTEGVCNLTESYCIGKGMDWDPSSKSCYETLGMEIAEALFGSTVVRGIFKGGCKLSDKRYKEKLTKIGPDFGGKGIHLYIFNYTKEALKLHPEYSATQTGFLADEIRGTYPEVIKNIDGRLYIDIQKEHIIAKPALRRIYNTIKAQHVILKAVLNRTTEFQRDLQDIFKKKEAHQKQK